MLYTWKNSICPLDSSFVEDVVAQMSVVCVVFWVCLTCLRIFSQYGAFYLLCFVFHFASVSDCLGDVLELFPELENEQFANHFCLCPSLVYY